jgi:hypothetical protein
MKGVELAQYTADLGAPRQRSDGGASPAGSANSAATRPMPLANSTRPRLVSATCGAMIDMPYIGLSGCDQRTRPVAGSRPLRLSASQISSSRAAPSPIIVGGQ